MHLAGIGIGYAFRAPISQQAVVDVRRLLRQRTGTRPKAIKLASVAAAMWAAGRLRPVLVATGQHPDMVHQALAAFGDRPDVHPSWTAATAGSRTCWPS